MHDIGLNGVKDIHSFYNNRVLGYNNRLHVQARNLREMCVNEAVKVEQNRTSDMTWEEHESGESSGNETSEADRSFKRYKSQCSFLFCNSRLKLLIMNL